MSSECFTNMDAWEKLYMQSNQQNSAKHIIKAK